MKFLIELGYQDLKTAISSGALAGLADTVENAKPEADNVIFSSQETPTHAQQPQTMQYNAPVEQPAPQFAYQQQPAVPVYQAPAPQPAYQPQTQQQPAYQVPAQQPQAPVQQSPYPQQSAPAMQPAPAVPTTQQGYTLEQLAVAATQINDAGRRQDLINLLAAFRVPALTELPKEQYGNFATQLRAMGAKI
jgi:hypothetical protein